MTKRSTCFAAARLSLVLLLAGAGACTSTATLHAGPAQPSGSAASAVTTGQVAPRFPEQARLEALEQAAAVGLAPAGGRTVTVGYEPEDQLYLLWQAEETGDICMAQALGDHALTRQCTQSSDISSAPSPGVRGILSAALNHRHDGFNAVLLSSGETVEQLACGGQVFEVTSVFTVEVAGLTRTVSKVTVPRDQGGTFRATVRRDGEPAQDSVELNARSEAQC
ncbi:hypothetical protein [Kitasatospora sp. NPDC057223]|uniref:hypothetical protein n=1 Tax=Kitasatospora sp. NPDC057223 TaxID=3346055 RepID=UPI00362B12AA